MTAVGQLQYAVMFYSISRAEVVTSHAGYGEEQCSNQ